MAMKIRLARGGSRKRPHYAIVASDSRMPRDGRFKEKLGTYSPLLPKNSEDRVKMNMERVQYWLDQGAQPTDRVSRFLEAAGVREKAERNNPQKAEPGKKARERAEEKASKTSAAKPAEEETTAPEADVETAVAEPAEETAASESDGEAAAAEGSEETAAPEPAEETVAEPDGENTAEEE